MALVSPIFGQTTDVYDPFSVDLFDPFSGYVFDPFQSVRGSTAFGNETVPARVNRRVSVDWKETPEAHVFMADLPGVEKEDVKVEVEDGYVLQIRGERRKEKKEKDEKWHRVERVGGRFRRRFRLPDNAMTDQMKATMHDGVLTVTIPKKKGKKPEVKAIKIDD